MAGCSVILTVPACKHQFGDPVEGNNPAPLILGRLAKSPLIEGFEYLYFYGALQGAVKPLGALRGAQSGAGLFPSTGCRGDVGGMSPITVPCRVSDAMPM